MIQGTTQVVGVFGWPVKHSASPAMHNAAFAHLGLDWVYVPFSVSPESIASALHGIRALNIAGVNVTVPLKELVPSFLDSISPMARAIGSVNTVVHREGRLHGESTDGAGLLAALDYGGLTVDAQTHAVVLGAGGSAKAVVRALLDAGATVTVANRSRERAEGLVTAVTTDLPTARVEFVPLREDTIGRVLADGATLLVNTTSVGMHPHEDEMPTVPVEALHPGLFVSDLIYNPPETRLLAMARQCGCRTQNGIEMLVRQGALAFHLWTGTMPPVAVMREAVYDALNPRKA
jgi:shikimate dehydrogenase